MLNILLELYELVSTARLRPVLEVQMKECLAQFAAMSRAITKPVKRLKEEFSRLGVSEGSSKEAEPFIAHLSKHILCKNLVSLMSKMLLTDKVFKSGAEAKLFETYVRVDVELKKKDQVLLLHPLLVSYYPDEDQLETKIKEWTNKLFPPKPAVEIPRETSHNHNHSHSQKDKLSKSVSLRAATEEKEKEPVVIDPSSLKPSTYALKDLDKVKQKRYEMKTIELNSSIMRARKEEKMEKFMTIQH